MFNRTQAKDRAKQIMSTRLSACVGADMLAILLSLVPFSVGAAKVGICTWYLEETSGKKPRMSSVLEGFSVFSRAIMGYIWYYLFLFLWTLPSLVFYIIGGIIAGSSIRDALNGSGTGLGFSIVFFILGILYTFVITIYKSSQYDFLFFYMANHPDKNAKECLDNAAAIAKDHIIGIIVARLSFIGWYILNFFTFNLLSIFYITPYVNLTLTELYKQMSGESAHGAGHSAANQPSNNGGTAYMPNSAGGAQNQRGNGVGSHKIVGLSGMYSGSSFDIAPNQQICIGRDPAYCQIVISSGGESVSRKHCLIQYDGNAGCFYVTDYSSNGTFLENGAKLNHNVPTPLNAGSVIVLGNRSNVFRLQ